MTQRPPRSTLQSTLFPSTTLFQSILGPDFDPADKSARDDLEASIGPAQGQLKSMGQLTLGRSNRSEEHTSELQSLMRTSYAVFCLKKKKYTIYNYNDLYYSILYSQYILYKSTLRQDH